MRLLTLMSFAIAMACLAPPQLPASSITLPVASSGLLSYFPPSQTPAFVSLPPQEVGDLFICSDLRYGHNETDVAIEFDLGMLRGQTVLDASLNLTANGSQTVTLGPILNVRSFLDDDLVVDAADFAKATGPELSSTGNLPLFAAEDTINVPLSFDVTNFIRTVTASPAAYAGFDLSVTQAGIYIDGLGTGTSAPRLVIQVAEDPDPIDALPGPGGGVLLGTGTLLFAAFRSLARARKMLPAQ